MRWAVRTGQAVAGLSRRLGLGQGGIIGGRLTLALAPAALSELAAGRRIVLVSGTNGKTTTSHLLAAALRKAGPVAHNDTGANMADGVLAALMRAPDASLAVLEVDELHLGTVAAAVHPEVVVLLNLTRDQLDRGTEVRTVAAAVRVALTAAPDATVVANADDPMVVWAVPRGSSAVWVQAGSSWLSDSVSCPRCGQALAFPSSSTSSLPSPWPGAGVPAWVCSSCGLRRPVPTWAAELDLAATPAGPVPLALQLPGAFNTANATMALAAGDLLGVHARQAAAAMAALDAVAGRYATIHHGDHELRLLLAKNPAGLTEILEVLEPARSLLIAINAREADGRDTSWLWDAPLETLADRHVIATGERAADLSVRLTYAGVDHATTTDPWAAIAQLRPGKVDVVANYTAFHQLLGHMRPTPAPTSASHRRARPRSTRPAGAR